jgi:hypothetical protein
MPSKKNGAKKRQSPKQELRSIGKILKADEKLVGRVAKRTERLMAKKAKLEAKLAKTAQASA